MAFFMLAIRIRLKFQLVRIILMVDHMFLHISYHAGNTMEKKKKEGIIHVISNKNYRRTC